MKIIDEFNGNLNEIGIFQKKIDSLIDFKN